jgi:hypothetical protein
MYHFVEGVFVLRTFGGEDPQHYGSHEMLHHVEPKLSFCLMHMFEIV